MQIRVLLVLFLCLDFLKAQELPPISVYTSLDYKAENQNWSIGQGVDEHMYIANNQGLMEFDGASWNLYPSPNGTIVRSVKIDGEKIYTGFYNGFGFWEKNDKGQLEFTSLSNELNLLDDEQFWGIELVEDWVVFQSLERIYFYNTTTQKIKVHEAETQILNVFTVENVLYYQEYGNGVYSMSKGNPELISAANLLKNSAVIGMHTVQDQLLFVTDNRGIWQKQEEDLVLWENELPNTIGAIYSTLQLHNGNIVIGTISKGIFVLNPQGKVLYQINQELGLSNNTVLAMYEDHQHSIWLGLDNGINVIDIDSPFRVYKDYTGVLGTVYTSITHKGLVYLGTNQGLFCKKMGTNDRFSFVKDTEGQVWSLKVLQGDLLCGHNSGTFLVQDTRAKKIANIMGGWKMVSLSENEFLQGTYNGLYVFVKNNQQWQLKNKVEGFTISSRHFERHGENIIFVNHEYKGVYQLYVNKDFTRVENIKQINTLPKGLNSSIFTYRGGVFYAYQNGVYRYQPKTKNFRKDTLISKYVSGSHYNSGVFVSTEKGDKIWAFAKYKIVSLEQGRLSTSPIIATYPISLDLRKGATGYENICYLGKDNYLIGNSDGYITLDLSKMKERNPCEVEISQIKKYSFGKQSQNLALHQKHLLEPDENSFEFYCSVPVFEKFKHVAFQYQLKGLSNTWSNWSTDPKIVLENLPFGTYQFSVKARVDGVETSNVANFSFVIDRPWYLSNLFLFIYVIAVVLFSIFMHQLYTIRHKREQRRLLLRKQRELQLQKLENDKKMTLLEKEKLEADVVVKSKELASSTMSIVKKNELLSTIKEELMEGQPKNIQNVIRIIDKNLSNQGDWRLFEEAFNNADKDFIKIMKQKHPALTPHDLRLCAYLRLNLSSKEIAPLLNISPKSVEVKRYRLRKKIDLTSEQNLVDYILNI
ncbi:LuxR C-terminal-related transcriptional regulator [Ochrovirga pacifica]|uniref:LuxR C-terminal-related transcriptional regulator n=1 Tax=Ochrovirga pacifica TaxID=1042376 RepID=UPI000255A28B|nr:LuxR C-terminal-related transcriptional regulator [Ochrovirga pacifica]